MFFPISQIDSEKRSLSEKCYLNVKYQFSNFKQCKRYCRAHSSWVAFVMLSISLIYDMNVYVGSREGVLPQWN